MKLSIIVLTYNRLVVLRECLTRILSLTTTRPAELIVIDNGSTDGTSDWLDLNLDKTPIAVHVLRRPTNEYVCARNYGIDIAKGSIIAQVDDDVLVHSGWDTELLRPFENPIIGAAGQEGFYQNYRWNRTPYSAGLIDDRRRPAIGQYADLVMGYCWAWRNSQRIESLDYVSGHGHVYEKIEADHSRPCFLYDWNFNPHWHEESDLQMQIRAAGYRIMVTPPVATHRSLKDWRRVKGPGADDILGEHIAEAHFELLKRKWADYDGMIYEGKAVGL